MLVHPALGSKSQMVAAMAMRSVPDNGNGHALCTRQPASAAWQHAAAIFDEFVILSILSYLSNANLQLCTGYCRGLSKYVYLSCRLNHCCVDDDEGGTASGGAVILLSNVRT